jgi:hypothetical protein
MIKYLVISKLLDILEKIPYRTKFGLSLGDLLKYFYYNQIGQYKKPKRCICGGIVTTIGCPPDGWVTDCVQCGLLVDED